MKQSQDYRVYNTQMPHLEANHTQLYHPSLQSQSLSVDYRGHSGWENTYHPSLQYQNSTIDYRGYSGLQGPYLGAIQTQWSHSGWDNTYHPSLQYQNSTIDYRGHSSLQGPYLGVIQTRSDSGWENTHHPSLQHHNSPVAQSSYSGRENTYNPSLQFKNSTINDRHAYGHTINYSQESSSTVTSFEHQLSSDISAPCKPQSISTPSGPEENIQNGQRHLVNYLYYLYERPDQEDQHDVNVSNSDKNNEYNHCNAYDRSINYCQENSSTVTSSEYQLTSHISVPCEPQVISAPSVQVVPTPSVQIVPTPSVEVVPTPSGQVISTPSGPEVTNERVELFESMTIKPKHKVGCDNSIMFVKTSDQPAKKLCCPFCDELFSKLAKHMEKKHSQEPDVRKFLSFTKKSPERRLIQDSLRKIGLLNFNKDAALNKRELIPSRRPNSKHQKKATDYTTCPYCSGPYAKSAIRFHIKYNCPQKPTADERTEGERVTTRLATSVEARYYENTSPALAKVFEKLRNDNIVLGIRFDWLLIVYGNKLSAKYTKRNSKEMIQNKMRLAGRIISALKDIEPGITDFAMLYRLKYYDSIVEAIRAIARVDPVRKEFIAPATAKSAVTAIRQIGAMLVAQYIKKEDREKKLITEEFLIFYNSQIDDDIGRMVIETQSRMARQKKVILPSSEDVKRLFQYVETQRTEYYNKLLISYSYNNWLLLSQFTIASIIVYNRRRVGDTENILNDDFTQKEEINQSTNEELFSNLSEHSKQIAKQFSRMKVRGKRNRTVPVLLKSNVENCLELLISHRQDAGISSDNQFLFALPSKIDEPKVVNAGRILKKFAKACGADNPSRLTATNLRKHIATVCVSLKLSDTVIADVAEHMGHAEKVHRESYRQNTIDRQIVQMSQILEAAQGNISVHNENEVQCNQMIGDAGYKRKIPSPSPDFEVKKKSRRLCTQNKKK